MAITNGYTTLAAFKSAVTISDTTDDTEIEAAVEAASRDIDALCGRRRFWQDATVVDRLYYPSESRRVYVDDISTSTGLLVKVDLDDDGTYETTLTINTDFIVEPVNAAAEYPVRPYESIKLLDGVLTTFPCSSSGRAPVQVTAKFGWVAVPDAIERACLAQTKHRWKAVDAVNETVTVSADGIPIRVPVVPMSVRMTCESFQRYTQVDDGA